MIRPELTRLRITTAIRTLALTLCTDAASAVASFISLLASSTSIPNTMIIPTKTNEFKVLPK